MSKGIGTHANKIAEDENAVIYEYGDYNLNVSISASWSLLHFSCKAFAIAKKACNPIATLRLITQMLHPSI